MGQASIELRTSPVAAGKRHSYIIFKNEAGQEYTIRGGPTRGDGLGDALLNTTLGADQFGPIQMSAQAFARAPGYTPVDWPRPGEKHESVVLWTGTNQQLQEKFDAAIKTAGQINEAKFEYSPLLNNCNNAASTVLKSIGIAPRLPLGQDGKPVEAPGFNTPLFKDVGAFGVRSGYSFDGKQWLDSAGKPMKAPEPGKVFEPQKPGSFDSPNFKISQNELEKSPDQQVAMAANKDVQAIYDKLHDGLGDKLTNAGAGKWIDPMLAETALACVKNGLKADNIGYMDINLEKNNILVMSQDKRQFAVVDAGIAAKANPQEQLDAASKLQETTQQNLTVAQQHVHEAPGRTV